MRGVVSGERGVIFRRKRRPASDGVPEVTTERLKLRGWQPDDLEPYLAMTADPEVMAHFPRTLDRADARHQIEWFSEHWRTHGFGVWAVESLGTGELVGRLGLILHPDWPHGPAEAEVGWLLRRDHWKRGLATEGGTAAIDFAWRSVGLRRLVSITRPANTASRAVMERLGFHFAGQRRWRDFDHVWYERDR